jgi:YgiT-type zinc finger domain-containing protein
MKNCYKCNAKVIREKRDVNFLNFNKEKFTVNIYGWFCDKCGEKYFNSDELREIEGTLTN